MTTKELTKKIKRISWELDLIKRQLALGLPQKQPKTSRRAYVLRQTGGALKHKIKGSTVAWQKKVRAEWK